MTNTPLSRSTLIFFAAPSIVFGMTHTASGSILAGIYAKNFDISLAALGTAMLMARVFDAITDPLIGFLSDRTKSPWGARKPWVVVGTLLTIISTYFFFIPVAEATAQYFMISYMAITLAWTICQIPTFAWQAELSSEYHERARVSTYRVISDRLGRLAFTLTPMLPIFATPSVTLETVKAIFWLVLILAPITLFFALWKVPIGTRVESKADDKFIDFLKTIPQNKPMLLLLLITLLGGLADGFFSSSIYFYIDVYLQKGEQFPLVLLLGQGSMLLTLPITLSLMRRFGKHIIWALGMFVLSVAALLLLMVEPESSVISILIPIMMIYSGAAAGNVASYAILADVIDYDTLKTGQNRSGQYFAFSTILEKANMAVGGAIAFYTLSWFGFNAQATQQTEMGDFGIKVAIAIMPCILSAIAIVVLFFFPLTEAKYKIIQRRLEQRRVRKDQSLIGTTVVVN